jgi:hypothetical protein
MPSGVHWIRKFDSFPLRNNLRDGTLGNIVAKMLLNYFIFFRAFNSFQIKYSITTMSGGLMMNRKKRI